MSTQCQQNAARQVTQCPAQASEKQVPLLLLPLHTSLLGNHLPNMESRESWSAAALPLAFPIPEQNEYCVHRCGGDVRHITFRLVHTTKFMWQGGAKWF